MCKCCITIEGWKNLKHIDLEYKLFTQLVLYGWIDGGRKTKGRQDWEHTSDIYDLNYCPVCGTKLKLKQL